MAAAAATVQPEYKRSKHDKNVYTIIFYYDTKSKLYLLKWRLSTGSIVFLCPVILFTHTKFGLNTINQSMYNFKQSVLAYK